MPVIKLFFCTAELRSKSMEILNNENVFISLAGIGLRNLVTISASSHALVLVIVINS